MYKPTEFYAPEASSGLLGGAVQGFQLAQAIRRAQAAKQKPRLKLAESQATLQADADPMAQLDSEFWQEGMA